MKYDAIVIGSGMSGGWAAKELCEGGLKTLVLERGRKVEHVKDYVTMNDDKWDYDLKGRPRPDTKDRQFKQARTGYTTRPEMAHWFVDDVEHPYNEEKRFDWMRGYQTGGRTIAWGRQSYRMGDLDFEANRKEGVGVDWPVRYADIKPWYDKVEEFIGVSGRNIGIEQIPDGKLLPPMELNVVEKDLQAKMASWGTSHLMTNGRTAHITGDKQFEGRVKCQFRSRCNRGCPYGAYFSSLSSTLPAALSTGNLTIQNNAIVHSIEYDEKTGRASGVNVIDAETKEKSTIYARIIFCCASSMASTAILLNSRSERFPTGMGNDSGELGHNIMDHHLGIGASAEIEGFDDKYYRGRRPSGFYIPRFSNMDEQSTSDKFIRGYGFQGSASRTNWTRGIRELSIGEPLKQELIAPGPWRIGMMAFGEILPHHDNHMRLDFDKRDQWGIPTVTFSAELKENEINMREDMRQQSKMILEKAGYKNVQVFENQYGIGLGIHEMGTARMGRDPKTSVLNEYNAIHEVPNVFVTDGAFMTSAACQNPSLTYMAFTARAADYAIKAFKENRI
ncbi:GMC oxidoreductase [Ningiella sp. W23]|uniref:GMC oxidoreductase n=1 Tax=Ningiella sp. W23 TaxID=3023715 RepID=UPI003756B8B8